MGRDELEINIHGYAAAKVSVDRETLYHVKEIYQVRSGLLAPVEKIGENGVNIRVCR